MDAPREFIRRQLLVEVQVLELELVMHVLVLGPHCPRRTRLRVSLACPLHRRASMDWMMTGLRSWMAGRRRIRRHSLHRAGSSGLVMDGGARAERAPTLMPLGTSRTLF